jgi:hypothetical protein
MQSKNRFETRQKAAVKRLAQIGPFVKGTMVQIKHPACKHVAHRLTFKVSGTTKAVYIPVDLIKEVMQWTRNYRTLKQVIRDVNRRSLAIIHHHVPLKRAAARRNGRPSRI